MSLFSKKERLTTSAFNRSFSLGKRAHSQYFQLIYHPSPTFAAAAVVGKKVSKKAVVRNLLRRQLYATLYSFVKQHCVKQVVIVVAKPALLQLSRLERRAQLQQLLEKTFIQK